MKLAILLVAAILALTFATGCANKTKVEMEQPYSNPQTFSGMLRNVSSLVGGASTGWELHMAKGYGRSPEVIPLDVSAVENDAKVLEGQQVMAKVAGRNGNAYVVQALRRVGE